MNRFNPRYLVFSDPDFATKIYVILPHELVNNITQELMKLGTIEIISIEKKEQFEKEIELLQEYVVLLDKAKNVYNELIQHIEEEVVVELKDLISVDSLRNYLKTLVDKFSNIVEKLRDINTTLKSLELRLREVEYLIMLAKSIPSSTKNVDTTLMRYIGKEYIVDTFYGPIDQMKIVSTKALGVIAEVIQDQTLISSMIFISREYDKILQSIGENIKRFEYLDKIKTMPLNSFINTLSEESKELKKGISTLVSDKKKIILDHVEDIAQLKVILDNEYERVKAIYNAIRSKYLTLIIGWIPRSKINNVMLLQKSFPIKIEIVSSLDEEPPAEFNNLKPFKPFELITEMFGTPSLKDWDPTPLLTYAFLMFFSLMMGDIGYSIGLIIGTKYVLSLFVDDPKSEGFRKLQKMLYIGGCGGIIVGILSRSFFGDLLGKYIPQQLQIIPSDPGAVIGLSLFIGWIWMIVSHILAFARNIIKIRDVYGALAEIAISILLALGLPFSLYFVSTRGLKPMLEPIITEETYVFIYQNISIIMIAIYIFLGLLIIAKIMSIKALGAILWLFDISGALGDILSFARIGGIALSSLLLANVFNSLINSIIYGGTVINIILGIAMALLCHLFILAISPIGPFVHSLRLCIIEINTKFYEGQNRRLLPLSIKIPSKIRISKGV